MRALDGRHHGPRDPRGKTPRTVAREAIERRQRHVIDPGPNGDYCRRCGFEIDGGKHLPTRPPCTHEGCLNRALAWRNLVGRNDAQLCLDHSPEEWAAEWRRGGV